jgi:type II secretory ATPase GspE/PulE/Tfp pilus assembly ATPase PilB-like protein
MGTEPFLLASSLVALTAQRLARKLCPRCKEKYILQEAESKRLGIDEFCRQHKTREFYSPKGCQYCNNSGYRGRIAVLEIILLDDKIKEMIIEKVPEETITQYARQYREYKSLKEDGFLKCAEGITSLEEVVRVTSE